MDHFKEYLAAEVALDHVDGQLTRREALRRMGMMGISLGAASAILAACADDDKGIDTSLPGAQASTTVAPAPLVTAPAGPTTTRPTTTPVPSQEITYPGPNSTLMGAYAPASRAKGAVVVIHQNRGLTDDMRAVVSRLAGDGYSALAVDLLSEEGGTAKVPAAEIGAALTNAGVTRMRSDIVATIDELARRNAGAKIALIGFCFGGTVVWDFVSVGDPRLAAAAPFYGTTAEGADFSKNKAAVLGVYGETDTRVNNTRDAARASLEKAGVPFEIKTYAGVGHGFYSQVDSVQSQLAYSDLLTWFDRHLK